MPYTFDVIIIGAGPAGLSCAEELKDSGQSVLIIEKSSVIGPKNCAGGLTPLAGNFDIPPEKTRTFNDPVLLLGDRKYRLHSHIPIRTIDREDLGRHLLSKIAGGRNITILTGLKVQSIHGCEVLTDRGTFRSRTLVGADGSFSVVRRSLGLITKMGFGFYFDIPRITDDFIMYFNPAVLRSGYLWVFPHVSYTSTGIGFDPDHLAVPEAKQILKKFITELGFSYSGHHLRGGALSYYYAGFHFGPVYLAGDAAGLISKATGEGISFAMASGREIGRKILDERYGMVEFKKMLRFKKRQESIWRVMEIIPPFQKSFLRVFFHLIGNKSLRSFFAHL
ncbi:MAG: NAD(P)/FAD-dependent oxidoreductase [Syntrophales bacterium]